MDEVKSGNIIELQDIVKIFTVKTEDVLVIKKVNVDIKNGDFVLLFGPSGCGKSTLLHVMLGLEPPTAGKAEFLNYDLYKLSEDGRSQFRKNHIGMVYQQPNWIRSLTVLENIAFAPALLGLEKSEGQARAMKALEMVGMSNWSNYFPTELSAGQQQKISFARAIVTDPKVIIADEPTGNLDYKSGIDIMNLFKEFNDRGITVIMVSHDPDSISYAKKVVQMFDGRVVDIHTVTASNANSIKSKLLEKKSITATLDQNDIDNKELLQKYRVSSPDQQMAKVRFSLKTLLPTLKEKIRNVRPLLASALYSTKDVVSFITLLFVYLGGRIFSIICQKVPLIERFAQKNKVWGRQTYDKVIEFLQYRHLNSISRIELIELSLKNMKAHKARSIITIGGMTIGIATIVFLVSLGYGLERLVISRVARLEEMKQIDAVSAVSSNVKITDKTISNLQELKSIKKVLPVVGLVGKVNYNNSNTDVAVYGVLADYLKESAIKPKDGEIFTSNEIAHNIPSKSVLTKGSQDSSLSKGEVAGATNKKVKSTPPKLLEVIEEITFKIYPNSFVRVRTKPDTVGSTLGYTRRIEGIQNGRELWGGTYIDNPKGESGTTEDGKKLGKWIQAKVPLWEKVTCSSDQDPTCEQNTYRPLLDEDGRQLFKEGYFAEISIEITSDSVAAVLAATDEVSTASSSADTLLTTSSSAKESSDEADILIRELLENKNLQDVKKISLSNSIKRVAVVNQSFLDVLSIDRGVGKKFKISFIATGALMDKGERVESQPTEYEIIGVTADTKTPVMYVPLLDLKELGLNQYSQLKIVVESQNEVSIAREQIEVMGLSTTSVVDTVSQIEQFFSTIRLMLGLLGVVALSVAALGMFNTLTISLLERTHEVGMMKAIGMKSDEVKNLFLTESMIMGVFGGIGGLFLGFAFGQILSLILSSFTVFRGLGYLNITYIPVGFVLIIITIAIVVGVATGVYPARRATKISALDALRYE